VTAGTSKNRTFTNDRGAPVADVQPRDLAGDLGADRFRGWRSSRQTTPMPPEHPLSVAAAHKHERALERARSALGELDARGEPISFQTVARRAGVSRQWLYTQPALRAEIEQLRDRTPATADRIPARQRATDASLRQRIDDLRAENRRLREENQSLRAELALIYGQQRDARTG
jgi:hypothetical protein